MKMQFFPEDVQKLEAQVADLNSSEESKELETYYQFFNAETEDITSDRKSTRLNSSHVSESRMPSSA